MIIAVKDSFQSSLLVTDPILEQAFVKISLSHSSLIIGSVYIPPNSPVETYEAFAAMVNLTLSNHNDSLALIMGDFNLPRIRWCKHRLGNGFLHESASAGAISSAMIISDCMNLHNLSQINSIFNIYHSQLDLAFSSASTTLVSLINTPLLPVDNYHPPILAEFSLSGPFKQRYSVKTFRDFRNADYSSIILKLNSCDWNRILGESTSDSATELFINTINSSISSHVPLRQVLNDAFFPPWVSSYLRKLIIKKKIAHRNYKRLRTPGSYAEFSILRTKCKTLSKSLFLKYHSKIENQIAQNPSNFWKIIRKRRDYSPLPKEISYNNVSASNDGDVADLFATFFQSVFTTPQLLPFPQPTEPFNTIDLSSLSISESEVFNSMCALKLSSSPGPDGLPNIFLITCLYSLVKPLTLLFNLSLQQGNFPSQWKYSRTIPIFKSGDPSLVSNYRPISILNSIPKLFETIVAGKISSLTKHLINPIQHGFTEGRSTTTNLILFKEDIVRALDEGCQLDVIYTDFAKAFDRVNHLILLNKLELFGFSGSVLAWMGSYLSGRTQSVTIADTYSNEYMQTSGVPQGSHLGPLLFNLFINDLPSCLRYVSSLFFADDAKFYLKITHPSDCLKVQEDLNAIMSWSTDNDLMINANKCEFVSFHRGKRSFPYQYKLGQDVIREVSVVTDLGIKFTDSLSFSSHLLDITQKANRTMAFVFRSMANFNNPSTLRLLYLSLVRPILEYASVIWRPTYKGEISNIESVQHRFLRRLAFLSNTPMDRFDHDYKPIETAFYITPLESRRLVADAIFLQKILSGACNSIALESLFSFYSPPRPLRKFPLFRTDLRKPSLSHVDSINRLRDIGNKLSNVIDLSNSSPAKLRSFILANWHQL